MFTGFGDIVGQPILISGSGDHAEAVPVTGTGAIIVPAARVSGIGVNGDEGDGILRGRLVTATSLRGTFTSSDGLGGTIELDDVLRGSIT